MVTAGPHAHATDLDGHDGALLKLHAVRREYREATLRLMAGREGDKSHDSVCTCPRTIAGSPKSLSSVTRTRDS